MEVKLLSIVFIQINTGEMAKKKQKHYLIQYHHNVAENQFSFSRELIDPQHFLYVRTINNVKWKSDIAGNVHMNFSTIRAKIDVDDIPTNLFGDTCHLTNNSTNLVHL